MKKLFVTIAVVGFLGLGIVGIISATTIQNSVSQAIDTDADFHNESHSGTCYCSHCDNQPLNQKLEQEYENVDCSTCQRTGKQNCSGKQSCSSCGGTGCKNGYTTNGGRNCAYGHCSYCGGDGVREVMDRWKHCPDCRQCDGKGWYKRLARQYYIYYCPRCKREYSGC